MFVLLKIDFLLGRGVLIMKHLLINNFNLKRNTYFANNIRHGRRAYNTLIGAPTMLYQRDIELASLVLYRLKYGPHFVRSVFKKK